MSIAIPKNIAKIENLDEILAEMMHAMPEPVTFHIRDGKANGHSIDPNEIDDVAEAIAESQFIYVLEGM